MSLRYIIGSEGSEKTEWMYREMLRLCEERPDCSVYYLVPDQATLQAQKDLVSRQKNGCVMNIDILSFSRLKPTTGPFCTAASIKSLALFPR